MAIIYSCLEGDQLHSKFWELMKFLGEEVDLESFPGYKGDMGKGRAYYDQWKFQVQIIYHVAALMNAEEHRRLIGNDIRMLSSFFLHN